MSDDQKDLMYLLSDDEELNNTTKALTPNDAEKNTPAPMNLQQMMMKIPPDFKKADIHGVSITFIIICREPTR